MFIPMWLIVVIIVYVLALAKTPPQPQNPPYYTGAPPTYPSLWMDLFKIVVFLVAVILAVLFLLLK